MRVSNETWLPKYGETFWQVMYDCRVKPEAWADGLLQRALQRVGNCYRTEAEARAAAERVRKAYLGMEGGEG